MRYYQRVILPDSSVLLYHKSDVFKTSIFNCYQYHTPITWQDQLCQSALGTLRLRSTKHFPTFSDLSRGLDELYSANLSLNRVASNRSAAQFALGKYISEIFLPEKMDVLGGLLLIFNDVLFDLKRGKDGNLYDRYLSYFKKDFEDSAALTQTEFSSYVTSRVNRILFEDSPFILSGKETEALTLLPELGIRQITAFYDRMENESVRYYLYDGEDEMEKVREKILSCLKPQNPDAAFTLGTYLRPVRTDFSEVEESRTFQQSFAYLSYRLPSNRPDMTTRLFHLILGGSPTSKLFAHVREEQGLCYSVQSRAMFSQGLMTLKCQTNAAHAKQAQFAMHEEFVQMQKGNFTATELENAKKFLISSILETKDDPEQLAGNGIECALRGENLDLENECESVKSVTKDDIVSLARAMTPDTAYRMLGSE